ncbi:MAG: hypothetical protein O7G85_04735 [Planctomycetota bacterium]|nr:hypothetical protein [Planctomycetota bacterium]
MTLVLYLLLGSTGCYSYRQVEVRVIDGSSREPLSGIEVVPIYNTVLEFFPPDRTTDVTDSKGIARLRVCYNYKTKYAGLYFRADGYLVDQDRPRSYFILSVDQLRLAIDDFHIEVELLSFEDYYFKYPLPG